MQILAYLLARFSEPSSYAGIGAVLALLGLHFSDTVIGQLAQFFAAGCALAALLLKERGIINGLVLAAGLAVAVALTACQQIADTAKKADPKLVGPLRFRDAAVAIGGALRGVDHRRLRYRRGDRQTGAGPNQRRLDREADRRCRKTARREIAPSYR